MGKLCPHCDRTFSETTAAKHIPKCKTTVNKPKRLVRKSKVVLEKPREDYTNKIKSIVERILRMQKRKSPYYQTKEASMFREGEEVRLWDGRMGNVRFIGRIDELQPGYWMGIEVNED